MDLLEAAKLKNVDGIVLSPSNADAIGIFVTDTFTDDSIPIIVIDRSLNQTLNRTIMTSLTTLIVMIPLCIMVSASIREFIIPLMVGVIVGCLSSIFVCSPLYYDMNKSSEESKYVKSTKKRK